jgi:hypothetical protein
VELYLCSPYVIIPWCLLTHTNNTNFRYILNNKIIKANSDRHMSVNADYSSTLTFFFVVAQITSAVERV